MNQDKNFKKQIERLLDQAGREHRSKHQGAYANRYVIHVTGQYGRHSALEHMPQLANADLAKFVPKTLTDVRAIIDAIKALSENPGTLTSGRAPS